MACSSCFMVAVAPWNLKSPPPTLSSTHKFKFKCYATTQQQSLVHNDDLQALLQALHCTSLLTSSIPQHSFLQLSSSSFLQILPSDLHHNLLNQPNRPQLLEVLFLFIHSFIIHLSLLLINY
jgi:hypothetical protein